MLFLFATIFLEIALDFHGGLSKKALSNHGESLTHDM